MNRDQAATGQALESLRDVVQRYPRTEYASDARLKIDMVNDQLAGKEMTIGRYYLRAGRHPGGDEPLQDGRSTATRPPPTRPRRCTGWSRPI